MSNPRQTLRDALLESLSHILNQHILHLTVFISSPKRTTSIFPHTSSSTGRCWETEYLVTLTSELPPLPLDPVKAGSTSTDAHLGSTPTSTRKVLTSAISAHLYTLPSDSSASILYISKVDSSGYLPPHSPSLTKPLVVSFLSYFLRPSTRPSRSLTITLFARSQGQYLFPDSSKSGSKKVLGGLGLCGWWKGVFEEVTRVIVGLGVKGEDITLTYLLPSYDADEAKGMLGPLRKPLPSDVNWSYSPPFAKPLLLSNGNGGTSSESLVPSLATLIPSVPDDPKTRFLEELVLEALESGSGRINKEKEKENVQSNGVSGGKPLSSVKKRTWKERSAAEEEEERKRSHSILSKTSAKEFWERMGFRQECISGDVTGFFTITAHEGSSNLGVNSISTISVASSVDSRPVELLSSSRLNIPITNSSDGFPQAMNANTSINNVKPESRSTLNSTPTSIPPTLPSSSLLSTSLNLSFSSTTTSSTSYDFSPGSSPNSTVSHLILERLLASLVNTDFKSLDSAIDGTRTWLSSTRAIVVDEIGEKGWENCCGVVQGKKGVDKGLGDGEKRKEEVVVTMLQPRKKKKV